MVKENAYKIVFLIVSYIIVGIIVYMALTNTGIFKYRVESKLKSVSSDIVRNFSNRLSSCKSITESVARDPSVRLIFFQMQIEGNRRDFINYLSRLRSSIKNAYKVVLIDNNGNFLVSSDYFDKDFNEFRLAQKYLLKNDFVFFGSFDVVYSITKIYDQRGVSIGYLAIGWYKDFFEQPYFEIKNLKFIQDLIVVNAPEKLSEESVKENSSLLVKNSIISENLKNYNLKLLFFRYSMGFDILNVAIIVLSIIFALFVTVWVLISLVSDRNIKIYEDVRESVLSEVDKSFESMSNLSNYSSSEYAISDKQDFALEDSRYKYEPIESDIVPFHGYITEKAIATVSEIFTYIKDSLKITKVMFMRKTEDGFVQVASEGFETEDFVIYFSDKIWEKFLSKGKAVSIKGDIKELYELGSRLKDELFEIIVFPVIDSFGDIKYLFVAGRRWTENEQGINVKKEIFSKIKYVMIDVGIS
ncbi:MAG: hypothetical protein N2712_05275 [Brevinematales bacterium]|nr:hypothetical protein [Brevinematales bacterium]